MANDNAVRVFTLDPPPAEMDAVTAEWLARQFRRLAMSTQITAEIGDGQEETSDGLREDLDNHTSDESDPHNTLKPWNVDLSTGDLYPNTAVPGDAGLGTLEKAVAYIALGTQEDVGTSGIEGILADNSDASGGGVMLIGIRDIDPANPPDPVVENAQIWCLGAPVYVGSQLYLETPQALTEDHELLIGSSVATPGGRNFAPVFIGPAKVYGQTQQATDATDIDVLDAGDVEIVTMTLTDPYVVGASFSFNVYLENLGNKVTLFDVILKVNGTPAQTYHRELVEQGSLVIDAFPISAALNAGDVLSLDVNAAGTAPQSFGWVRGTIQQTVIRLSQG